MRLPTNAPRWRFQSVLMFTLIVVVEVAWMVALVYLASRFL
jgi:hypothetical protein